MTTLYDKIFDEVAEGIDRAEALKLLEHDDAQSLRQHVSDWLDELETADTERKIEEDNELELRLEAEQDKNDFIEQELAYA